jgi:hypothetical protein
MPPKRPPVRSRRPSPKKKKVNVETDSSWGGGVPSEALMHARPIRREHIEPSAFAEEVLKALLEETVLRAHEHTGMHHLIASHEDLIRIKRYLMEHIRAHLQLAPSRTAQLECLRYLEELARWELEARRSDPNRLKHATRTQVMQEERAHIMLKLIAETAATLRRQLSARR